MTAFAICLLLFAANLLTYQSAAILLPLTGALCLVSGLRLWLLHRRSRNPKRHVHTGGACPGGACRSANQSQQARGTTGFSARTGAPQQGRKSKPTLTLTRSKQGRGQGDAPTEGGANAQAGKKGKVLYASFPSTKEGRERAIEAFNRETSESLEDKEGRPLQ